jgi:hypothetical protein
MSNQDVKDALEVLAFTGFAARCVGGRIVAGGWQCIHCGSPEPAAECREPISKNTGKLLKRPARRQEDEG